MERSNFGKLHHVAMVVADIQVAIKYHCDILD